MENIQPTVDCSARPATEPRLVSFGSIGSSELGYIAVAEGERVPFEIKRVYWAYHTPHNVVRGKHAHKKLRQVLLAVSGIIQVTLETPDGRSSVYTLDNPSVGLYIPEMTWRTIKFSHNAVMMCLASMQFEESDYIRNYEQFRQTAGST